ncbi:MAG: squalene/phytoene synthase family protein, partial [Myxococcota bacterium]
MTMLADLLHRTSRSFALSIPVAPDPVGHEMTVGYLLFRIADTFEDCTHAPVEQRVAGLHAFCRALLTPGDKTMRRSLREHARHLPERNADYRALLASCDAVLDGLMALRPGAAELVAAHSSRTAAACVDWIRRTDSDGVFRLHSLNELRAYCYAVAGIPGEMLCELFILDRPELWPVAEDLRERAAVFGEAMQLVNIL